MSHRRPRLSEIRAAMRAVILEDETRAVRDKVDAAGLTRTESGVDRRPRGRSGAHHPDARRILHHAGLPRRVRTLDARGRGAHVPRRGAAAGPGHGDHRCADRGQDRGVGLGGAPRTLELAAGQCLHLGVAADRQGARRSGGRPGGSAARSDQAPRRAGHPQHRGRAGDARARTPVRARTRHARGQRPRGRDGGAGLQLSRTTCWGRRPVPRRTRAATTSRIPTRSPRWRASVEAPAFRDRPGVSVKLSALHARYEFAQRDPGDDRGGRTTALARAARPVRRHRPERRCRGGGPARPLARTS